MKKWICALVAVTLAFSAAAVGLTYHLIEKHKTPPAAPPMTDTPPVTEHRGIDLYGTYDENDLLYTDEAVTYKGVEITIPHIAGLKDKTVEERVNRQMEEKIYAMLDSFTQVTYASGNLSANFGNVISIGFSAGHAEGYGRLFLNYDLVTGRELRLEDLFYEDTDTLSLVREAFYETLSLQDYRYGEAVSPNENQLYKLVKTYMQAENPAFTFTPADVFFYSGEYSAEVSFMDIYEQVSIYERFLTENSIFADDNIGFDNIFTCADATQFRHFKHMDFGTKGENLWYDVSMMSDWLPTDLTPAQLAQVDAASQALFTEIYADLDIRAQEAAAHPDTFYILLYKPGYNVLSRSKYVNNTWLYTPAHAMETAWNLEVYEVPMELYETVYRDRLIAAYRYQYFFMAGGAWIDRYQDEADAAYYTRIENMRLVDLRNGEALTLETVFRPGADYAFHVRNEIIHRLTNGWSGEVYAAHRAIELAQTAEIYLSGGTVRAKIPALPDFDLWYSLSEFPEDMTTIFN